MYTTMRKELKRRYMIKRLIKMFYALLIGFLVGVAVLSVHFIATFDFCPLYYGLNCL